MTDNNKKQNMAGTMVHEGYEASVGARVLQRSGASATQLTSKAKGIAHEIMYCDKLNVNPENLVKGVHAGLTKSSTAPMKDIILKNTHGRIAGHAQLKDTISPAGIRKTLDQMASGKYNKTAMMGTEETAQKVNELADKLGIKCQKIKSTGISSKTTERVAEKTLGRMPKVATLGNAAKSGGAAGAVFGAGMEAVSSISDVMNGDKDVDEAVADVAVAGIKGGIAGAASTVASSVAAGAAGSIVTAATGTAIGGAIAGTAVGGAVVAAAPLVIGFGAACAIGSLISDIFD